MDNNTLMIKATLNYFMENRPSITITEQAGYLAIFEANKDVIATFDNRHFYTAYLSTIKAIAKLDEEAFKDVELQRSDNTKLVIDGEEFIIDTSYADVYELVYDMLSSYLKFNKDELR